MRKRFFMFILAILLAIPGVVFLTACGENGSKDTKTINGIGIKVGDNEWMSTVNCFYGKTVGQMYDDVSFYFTYSDGSKKDIAEENFSAKEWQEIQDSHTESWKIKTGYDNETSVVIYEDLAKPTADTVLEVGDYRVDVSIKNKTASIYITVQMADAQAKELSVVILPNEDNNYSAKLNSVQTYKFGMPANNMEYQDENYTSDYKIYVVDKDNNNKVVSGTIVKQVCALPEKYEGGVYSSFDDIEEGDNLLDYYNAIEVLDESDNVDEKATFERKQAFLSAYGREITANHNYSDDALILETEWLRPGSYHLFAWYEDKNYQPCHSEPITELVVEKGVFNLKKAIRYNDQDWSAEDANEILKKIAIEVNYHFDANSPLNTVDSQQNVVKALTAAYLNQSYVRSNSDFDTDGTFENVNFNLAGGGFTGLSYGSFKLVEKDSQNKDIRFDADSVADNTVKFVYTLGENDYYEEDPTVYSLSDFASVEFNFVKGVVERPYYYNENIKKEYNGQTITVVDAGLNIENANLLEYTGTYSTSAIGNHTITYRLKDNVNFVFDDNGFYHYGEDDGNGGLVYSWSITPIEFAGWGTEYHNLEATYNNDTTSGTSVTIDYVSGQKTITVSLITDSRFEFLKSKVPTAHIVWERVETDSDAVATLTQNGDDLTITFESEGYVNLKATIAETAYSLAFENENLSVVINKADFTQEQKTAILAEIGAEETSNGEYRLDEDHKIVVSNVDLILPNVLPDYTDTLDPPATANLGQWKLYHYENGEYVEKHNGDQLESQDPAGWKFKFVPADGMFEGLEVYLDSIEDISFVNEDIPANVLNSLKNEFATKYGVSFTNDFDSTATITSIYADASGYGSHENFLPEHDNEEEGAFEGEWVLCFDVVSGDYQYDVTLQNNSQYSYSELNEEYIKSSERNWRIKFIPTNTAYNPIEISVTVSFN